MSDILEELSALRRADAAEREKSLTLAALERSIAGMDKAQDFFAAFKADCAGPHIIAELKKASPSEGLIREDFDYRRIAIDFEKAGAAAISVLCECHRFLGSEEYLRQVRALVRLPLLYKDFITTRYQIAAARVAGADAVLLIAAVLDDKALSELLNTARGYGLQALVETHTATEIKRAVQSGARIIGVNCRDLRTFKTDPAITAELIDDIPESIVRIAESGIKTRADIEFLKARGADGFLIGTTLMRAPDPAAKVTELSTYLPR